MGGASGNQIQTWVPFGPTGGPLVVAAPDLNGDGSPEAVFQYTTGSFNGAVGAWYNSIIAGIAYLQFGWIDYNGSDLYGWRIVGFADLNQDGFPDMVVQNAGGDMWVWYLSDMSGTLAVLNKILIAQHVVDQYGAIWNGIAMADLNDDRNQDILLQNSNGLGALLLNSSATPLGSPIFITGTNGWTVVGCLDVDGNGSPDYIIYNSQVQGGTAGIWYTAYQYPTMTITGYAPIATNFSGWSIVAQSAPVKTGAVVVSSQNTVSDSTNDPTHTSNYRWEPSSAFGGNWISSWHELGTVPGNPNTSVTHAYTSAWIGNSWSTAFEHRTPDYNFPVMDTFTYWDGKRGKYALAAVDLLTAPSVWVRYSTDGTGTSWQSMVLAMKSNLEAPQITTPVSWDFPSIAVSATGRIVVAASYINVQTNAGYWASYSDDGINWSPPCLVNNTTPSPVCMTQSGVQPQGTGGATSRIVWSASGFHAFVQQVSGSTDTLQHWQSSDGITWIQQPNVATYGVPNLSATENNINGGQLSYSATPDAVASPGLGWVVAYPVNDLGFNAINVSTELGGAVTINCCGDVSLDLFNHGITTSGAGDWYLTVQTYLPRTFSYLLENAVYRSPGYPPTYLNNTIQGYIDPSRWWYYNSNGRCLSGSTHCYTAGDWFRPTMNTASIGSVPLILGSANLNDLFQNFIHDPPQTIDSQVQLTITPFQNGSNIYTKAVITPAIQQQISLGRYSFVASSMFYARLAATSAPH